LRQPSAVFAAKFGERIGPLGTRDRDSESELDDSGNLGTCRRAAKIPYIQYKWDVINDPGHQIKSQSQETPIDRRNE